MRLADIDSWLRVLRTVRHLRGSQIAHRLRRLASRRLPFTALKLPAPTGELTLDSPAPSAPGPAMQQFAGPQLVDELERGALTLVNRTLPMSAESPDWRLGPQSRDRLWAITLHYHAWLHELSRLAAGPGPLAPRADALWSRLLRDWLRRCRSESPGAEALAWNSFAIATRLGWWAQTWQLRRPFWQGRAELARDFLGSMHAQARHLHSHLEWDLRANHLLRDAVGLAWAGRFFRGVEADRWLRDATRIAVSQAEEQVLDDGGHFERSPFYHLEVMDDWLTLSALLPDAAAAEKMRATWRRCAEYARWLCHGDGAVAQFNDGAAVAARPYLARGAALSLGVDPGPPRGGRWMQETGVVAWHGDPWTLFWDVGEVGPACQPGHAHADTLSIEASFDGQRLFVDPGCFSYDHDSVRRYDRSTGAHNTVCIDEQDSSEVWHIFRVGRRARVTGATVEFSSDGFSGAASHTGYDHLSGRPRHERQVAVDGAELKLVDVLRGKRSHVAEGGLLLDPAWAAESVDGGWLLSCRGRRVAVRIAASQPLVTEIQDRPIHPEYGIELPTRRLAWRFAGRFPLTVSTQVAPAEAAAECSSGRQSRSLP